MRKWIALAVLAAMGFGGWWVYASYSMRQQATELVRRIGAEVVVTQRGLPPLPSDAHIRAGIQELADEYGAEIHNMQIQHEAVDGAEHPERLGPTTARVQKILTKLTGQRRPTSTIGSDMVSFTRTTPRVRAQRYEVHGQIVFSRGLWSHSEELSLTKVLGQRVEL